MSNPPTRPHRPGLTASVGLRVLVGSPSVRTRACVRACAAQDMRVAGLPLSDGVAELMVQQGLRTSFEEAAPGRPPPGSSAWSGALVDFLWHLRHVEPGGGGLRCVGSWLVYTDASDHLPLVADYTYLPPTRHGWFARLDETRQLRFDVLQQ